MSVIACGTNVLQKMDFIVILASTVVKGCCPHKDWV